jgi:hypothetical protein
MDGILPSGRLLDATVQGDVELKGHQAACGSCHRRSGFGSTESGRIVPPIVGTLLYRSFERVSVISAHRRSDGPGTRPAYTDETLARAIRQGVNSGGRPLDPMMPRYSLDDAGMDLLIGYLRSLSPGPDPGVTETTVHLATVVTDGVDPARRKAMLDVLTTFVATKNALTRNEIKRRAYARRSGIPEQGAYRTWALHVWELKGPTDTWPAQLQAAYARQPVFALLSGMAHGAWKPVHDFCEAHRVPCLFPNTDRPVVADGDFYSFYFSRGLALEADVIARRLLGERSPVEERVVQVFRAGEDGEAAATALRRAVSTASLGVLVDCPVHPGVRISADFWRDLLRRERPDTMVLWLHGRDLATVSLALASFAPIHTVFLSAALAPEVGTVLPPELAPKALVVYPYDMPTTLERRLPRVHVWLQAKKIPIVDEREQANTLFAATMVGDALAELLGNFSRAFFIECIEHMVDSAVPTSAFPRLTLGPGERYASKGCYLLRPVEIGGQAPPEHTWVVP